MSKKRPFNEADPGADQPDSHLRTRARTHCSTQGGGDAAHVNRLIEDSKLPIPEPHCCHEGKWVAKFVGSSTEREDEEGEGGHEMEEEDEMYEAHSSTNDEEMASNTVFPRSIALSQCLAEIVELQQCGLNPYDARLVLEDHGGDAQAIRDKVTDMMSSEFLNLPPADLHSSRSTCPVCLDEVKEEDGSALYFDCGQAICTDCATQGMEIMHADNGPSTCYRCPFSKKVPLSGNPCRGIMGPSPYGSSKGMRIVEKDSNSGRQSSLEINHGPGEHCAVLTAQKHAFEEYAMRCCGFMPCTSTICRALGGEASGIYLNFRPASLKPLKCSFCMDEYCVACSTTSGKAVKSHRPLTCSEKVTVSMVVQNLGGKLAAVVENRRTSDELVNKIAKLCPRCSARIQKGGGCMHMTCQVSTCRCGQFLLLQSPNECFNTPLMVIM